MRQHLLAGRFGPQDKISIASLQDELVTTFQLVAGKKTLIHGIQNAIDDLKRIKVFPSEIGVDLIILAAHVHAADTRVSRSSESQDTWTREFRLVVPVSNPAIWKTTSSLLTRILNFLTGDKWAIGFRARPKGFSTTVLQETKDFIGPPFDSVNLFSGGLDSLIGAIDSLETEKVPLFVSHAGEGATSAAQNVCYDSLNKHYKKQTFDRLRLWLNFPNKLVKNVSSEDTTRGRSFLFFALGIFAGTGLRKPFVLKAPENGLIALNVPLDIVRLGSLSTRTTHPFYIARWNELLSLLDIQARIENPYWNKTKGEMAKECANQKLLKKITPDSLSCSSPTKRRWQGIGVEHCGYCLPCLIRRAALQVAFGKRNDSTTYTISNLKAHTLNTLQAEGQQVRSFQLAIEKLRQRPDLSKILIHKSGSLADETHNLNGLSGVYQRGIQEVAMLLSGVKSKPS
ncbi:MAG: Qat anti-phage system QueC-like protein QatC [Nitrospinales bacterium]